MKFEIQTIFEEVISPSFPTPDHLHKHKLSFLDKANPPIFMPILLFYKANIGFSNSNISNHLRKSLSQALTLYYPLAGRLVDNSYINCNDAGVVYVEARADCKLLDVITDPIPRDLNKLLPCDQDDIRDLCMVVQATFFSCGGIAIGLGISHKVGDGSSLFMFLNSWGAISREDDCVLSPNFISETLFPSRDIVGYSPRSGMEKKEDVISKRFIFTASKISTLRDKYAKKEPRDLGRPLQSGRPTRVEALSAFIWTRLMVSTGAKDDDSRIYALIHAMNLRTRAVPPFPKNYFGNISWPTIAIPSTKDAQESGFGVVEKLRDAIRNVNGDYVSKLMQGEQYSNIFKDQAKDFLKGKMVSFRFSSMCKMPFYEADFGWGKPIWVGRGSYGFKNLVHFLDSASGEGIEAWVHMKPEDMSKFEADEELLAYVSSGHDVELPDA